MNKGTTTDCEIDVKILCAILQDKNRVLKAAGCSITEKQVNQLYEYAKGIQIEYAAKELAIKIRNKDTDMTPDEQKAEAKNKIMALSIFDEHEIDKIIIEAESFMIKNPCFGCEHAIYFMGWTSPYAPKGAPECCIGCPRYITRAQGGAALSRVITQLMEAEGMKDE